MAKWKVIPKTEGNTMRSVIDYDDTSNRFEVSQDITETMKEIQRDRDLLSTGRHNKHGFKKLCTIPDVVAIEMMQQHNLDIHHPDFNADPNNMKRLRYILRTEYPHLLISGT